MGNVPISSGLVTSRILLPEKVPLVKLDSCSLSDYFISVLLDIGFTKVQGALLGN